ncbi:AAA family ATPase [Pedobacter alluvionis]|uniref:MoxR family ATPase n=1 Tax=Pedobacter alluvionis TaxID=475253 RepID=A0A497YFA5_9SPHI|nr:MoxR family ATPase [Pedobacter alluvionis]RLJ80089.1 MoxR-like ATPase [Pedobacter alluvionis]TFB31381.1 MoxR family ATPase [Pedobacter alluvionis]
MRYIEAQYRHTKKSTVLERSESNLKILINKISLLKSEIQKVIVGQDVIIEEMLIALMAGGHCLLEGVPGLAKTLMVRTMSQALDLSFRRIQFTPDLMPTDIVGTEILEEDHVTGKRFFKFNKGPLFANIILADEVNRTPPKTQSALLEAMQEFEVTYGGQTYPLDRPFFILATQNPIEQAGTYPLPEAQLDRFLLYIKIGYPTAAEENQILSSTTGSKKAVINPIIGAEEIKELQAITREVSISDDLITYVSEIIRATRPDTTTVNFVKEWVRWGAGPRAGQALILTAKARALFKGRYAVIMEDLQAMAYPVLRHRVLMNFKAEAENVSSDKVTDELIKAISKPKANI